MMVTSCLRLFILLCWGWQIIGSAEGPRKRPIKKPEALNSDLFRNDDEINTAIHRRHWNRTVKHRVSFDKDFILTLICAGHSPYINGKYEELISTGMSPEKARTKAVKIFLAEYHKRYKQSFQSASFEKWSQYLGKNPLLKTTDRPFNLLRGPAKK